MAGCLQREQETLAAAGRRGLCEMKAQLRVCVAPRVHMCAGVQRPEVNLGCWSSVGTYLVLFA